MKPLQSVVLRAESHQIETVSPAGERWKLIELQRLVGGFIQVLYPPSRSGALLIASEEGKLSGLPVNVLASAVFGSGDVIFGDAVPVPPEQMAE